MSYQDKEIKKIIEEIKENKIYLPAIQRKLVWNHEQIEKLFDSIMRGYPIGTFLFWKLNGNAVNNYTFYKFIQEFEREKTKNEVSPSPESREEIIGVLDGQQRLNSIYIALQGSYAYKKPYVRMNNPNAFPKRHFYLNLLYSVAEDEEQFDECDECGYDHVPPDATACPNCGIEFEIEDSGGYKYKFKFLTPQESSVIDENTYWFPVKDVLLWRDITSVEDFCESKMEELPSLNKILQSKEKKQLFKRNLGLLWQRIVSDKVISYFEIDEPDLENILDIFVRVNSAGTALSKTDLLFSTIVAHWEGGRDEVDRLIDNINSKGDKFNFKTDFIMRSCLVLIDAEVLFKVKTFKPENIKKIKDEWPGIKDSIEKTTDLLVEFGFNGDTLTSKMAIIPIAYFFMKKGIDYKLTDEKDKKAIRYYLIAALLKQVYGVQGDQVLGKIREVLRKKEMIDGKIHYSLANKDFPIDQILKASLPSNKSFSFENKDIDEILSYKKGSYTFMVLSLMYPNLRFGQVKFHQDHLHPKATFTHSKLSTLGLSQQQEDEWMVKVDLLPNLQLLEGAENESKNKTPLKKWFEDNVPDKVKYKSENYIPEDVDLDLAEFDKFFSKRSAILKDKIRSLLLK